eukprot:3067888-Prymnesium_polylepis.1
MLPRSEQPRRGAEGAVCKPDGLRQATHPVRGDLHAAAVVHVGNLHTDGVHADTCGAQEDR